MVCAWKGGVLRLDCPEVAASLHAVGLPSAPGGITQREAVDIKSVAVVFDPALHTPALLEVHAIVG
jgi:hypothetical protein